MLKNRKVSRGYKSRHIHIRYFFTKDVLDRGDMQIEHYPTKEMIANFYTKPLQGKHFYNLRQLIMGHSNIAVEERVEGNDNKTTDNSTNKQVSKTRSREVTNYGYKVSSNFH